jgi:hypothetical protein
MTPSRSRTAATLQRLRLNYETYGIAADIPALIYGRMPLTRTTFLLVNNKPPRTPTQIRADNTRICSKLLRAMGPATNPHGGRRFMGCADLADYPSGRSHVMAALFLAAKG